MSKILAVIFFLGLIFLASCNTSQPTNVQEEPSMLKGKVIDYEGSGHLLEARFYIPQ